MRRVVSNADGTALSLYALDEPDDSGQCSEYEICGAEQATRLLFQQGPINQAGVNGISDASVLSIVADRLRGAQSVKADKFKALMLQSVEAALYWYRVDKENQRGI